MSRNGEYRDTIKGVCPECDERYPGHVYLDPNTDAVGWECPNCGTMYDPTNIPRFKVRND
jgi:uncharacterized Zn-finger protein